MQKNLTQRRKEMPVENNSRDWSVWPIIAFTSSLVFA
jgi:hypothetical protein